MIKVSPYQKTFYYEWQINKNSIDYNYLADLKLSGDISIVQLNKSMVSFINDHYIINSNILSLDTELYWNYRGEITVDTQVVIFEEKLPTKEKLKELVCQSFDYEKDLLIRCYLFLDSCRNYRFIVIMPHAVVDGLSYEELMSELNHYCNDIQYHTTLSLEEQKKRYETFINNIDYILSTYSDKMQSFWKTYLEGIEPIDLSFLKKGKSEIKEYKVIEEMLFSFSESEFYQIQTNCIQYGISPYLLSQTAFCILFHNYSGQRKISYNFTVGMSEGKGLIYGSQVNTIIHNVSIHEHSSINDVIRSISEFYKELRRSKAKYYPVYDIMKYSPCKEVLDVSFVQTTLRNIPLIINGIETVQVQHELDVDLNSIIAFEQEIKDSLLSYRVRFDANIIDRHLLTNFLEAFKKIFVAISHDLVTNDEKKVAFYNVFSLLPNVDFLMSHSFPERIYPVNNTIVDLFEKQVAKTPNNIAVIFNKKALTYNQLNIRVNKLAEFLIETYGIGCNDLVSLCLNRSEYMIVGILAILKAGSAYVPISPAFPSERIKYILNDIKCKVILIDRCNRDKLTDIFDDVVCIDDEFIYEAYSIENINRNIIPSDLAYVIYTSGTTGNPKGVLVEHKGVVNLITYLHEKYEMRSIETILLFANYIFDASIEQMYLALLHGHTLVVIEEGLWGDSERFIATLNKHKISYIDMTPSFLLELPINEIPTLKYVVAGGEAVTPGLLKKVSKGEYTFINTYGPTETTITSVLNIGNNTLNIGKPIANTTVYVLDKRKEVVPLGVVGELYIGGIGVTRGYLNKVDLTNEKYITNNIEVKRKEIIEFNERLYATGDLVRLLPNGDLEYIGRNDFQVKIRGFRIELGEIETNIMSYGNIEHVFVVAKKRDLSNIKYLVAYYVSNQNIDESLLISFLLERLPEYMVPSYFVHINQIPLSLSGKIDFSALPEPKLDAEDRYVAPITRHEKDICTLFSEVLSVRTESIGIRDDFFRLGGDSITSIRLIAKIKKLYNVNYTVKDIFRLRTVGNISNNILKLINENETKKRGEIEEFNGPFELSPMQKYIMESFNPNIYIIHYVINVPVLNREVLQKSFSLLADFHSILKHTFFQTDDGEYMQQKSRRVNGDLAIIKDNLTSESFRNRIVALKGEIDIYQNKLFKFIYSEDEDGKKAQINILLSCLIADKESAIIIGDNLKKIYEFLVDNKTDISVFDILGYRDNSYHKWIKYLYETFPHQSFPSCESVDNNKKKTKFTSNDKVDFSFDKILIDSKNLNNIYNTNSEDILVASLYLTLKELINIDDTVVVREKGRKTGMSTNDIKEVVGQYSHLSLVELIHINAIEEFIIYAKESRRSSKNNLYGGLPQLINSQHIIIDYFDHNDCFGDVDWSGTFNYDDNFVTPYIKICIIDALDKVRIKIMGVVQQLYSFSSAFIKNYEKIVSFLQNATRTYLTPSDVNYVISERYLNDIQETEEVEDIFLANSLQQGFVYHSLNQGDYDNSYHGHIIWNYYRDIDEKCLKKAWENAIVKYPALSIRFSWEEEIVQIVDKKKQLNWFYFDLTAPKYDGYLKENLLLEIQANDRKQKFDLSKGQLTRVYLIKVEKEHYQCILSNHHSVIDGLSISILLEYVHKCYMYLLESKDIEIVRDISYAETQKYIQNNSSSAMYWKHEISIIDDMEDLSSLLIEDKRVEVDLLDYKHIKQPNEKKLCFNGQESLEIKEFCLNQEVSINALFQYCWHYILSIYGRSSVTVVGTVVSGRDLPIDGIEQSVGLYINTLPLIVEHEDSSIIKIIKQIQQKVGEINNNCDVKLASLQKNGKRLFCSLFTFENIPLDASDELSSCMKMKMDKSQDTLDYPLAIILYNYENQIVLSLQYASELFSEGTIEQILCHFNLLVRRIVFEKVLLVEKLSLLTASEFQDLILKPNETYREFGIEKSVIEVFEDTVAEYPHVDAVVCDGIAITYQHLNLNANKLAHYLRDNYGVKRHDLVLLCFERSVYPIISILATLKTGAAYIPMSNESPIERLQYIIKDTNSKIILCDSASIDYLKNCKISRDIPILDISSNSFMQQVDNMPDGNLVHELDMSDLVYLIYTSGTTGMPKGVMIENVNVYNYIFNLNELIDKNITKFDFSGNYSFDMSVSCVIYPLCFGKTIYVFTDKLTSVDKYIEHLVINDIEVIKHTPTYLPILAKSYPGKLKIIISGGEKLQESIANEVRKITEIIIDEYGPTETCVGATYYIIDSNTISYSIGKPYKNYKLYVLDKGLKPVPKGVVGELYIGGKGVARGYLNLNELTSSKFLPNPFQTQEERNLNYNDRFYATGDLVRFLSNGDLEYIGRNDSQVKIRGFRVELGEIENRIREFDAIEQATVIVSTAKSGNPIIIAYYVSASEVDLDTLSAFLTRTLPAYMIPSYFVRINAIPLSISGKLNKSLLPIPEMPDKDNVLPKNATEEGLLNEFSDILNIDREKISTTNDFFALGGDSISSIRLIGKIQQEFNVRLTIKDVYCHRSIENLSTAIISKMNLKQDTILNESGILCGEFELLPIQKWFFLLKSRGQLPIYNHWNQSFLIDTPQLNIETLKKAIYKLVEYHDSLRIRFVEKENGSYVQEYMKDVNVEIKEMRINGLSMIELNDILTKWQSEFSLKEGHLFQIGYINMYENNTGKIFVAMHHLITDIVSWGILKEDIKKLYVHFTVNPNSEETSEDILGEKKTSYRQWVNYVESNYREDYPDEKKIWDEVIVAPSKGNKILMDNVKGVLSTYRICIDSKMTKMLLRDVNHILGTTTSDILLSALALSLRKITGEKEHSITLEGHGREGVCENIDLSHTVGWFTTLYPIKLVAQDTNRDTIIKTKDALWKIPRNGLGYSTIIGYEAEELPSIVFNYFGQINNTSTLWNILDQKAGDNIADLNRDYFQLSINGGIINDKLEFTISGGLCVEQLKKLSISFKRKIEELIKLLCGINRTFLTSSDVKWVISSNLLNKIQKNAEVLNIFKANNLQRGFVFHYLSNSIDYIYNTQLIWRYNQPINVAVLKRSWEYALEKFPSLRLRFNWEEEIVQILDKEPHYEWMYHNISVLSPVERKEYLEKVILDNKTRCYDLSIGKLLRIGLVEESATSFICIMGAHHAILDGWSTPIIIQFVHDTYCSLLKGEEIVIRVDDAYVAAQQYLQVATFSDEIFWAKYISKLDTKEQLLALLKTDKSTILLSEYKKIENSKNKYLSIRNELFIALKRYCAENGVTVNAVLQYCWHKQLSIYGNSSQTVIGMTTSGRNIPIDNIESSVGVYINTLPIILTHTKGLIIDTVRELQNYIAEINSHTNISLSKLQKGGQRFFNTIFVYENYPKPKESVLNFEIISATDGIEYPLGITVMEGTEIITLELSYASELFQEDMIDQMFSGILILLEQIVDSSTLNTFELKLANKSAHDFSVKNVNNTNIDQWTQFEIEK